MSLSGDEKTDFQFDKKFLHIAVWYPLDTVQGIRYQILESKTGYNRVKSVQ